MMIAARNAFLMSGAGPTARDYVQDGLVAMWDGIENAGWGMHNDTPSQFFDLISSTGKSFAQGVSYDNAARAYIVESGAYTDITMSDSVFPAHECTLEAVWAKTSRVSSPTGSGVGFGYNRFIVSNNRNAIDNIVACIYIPANNRWAWYITDAAMAVDDIVCVSHYGLDAPYINAAQAGLVRTIFSGGNDTSATPKITRENAGVRLYAMRIYSRALTAAEVAANYAIDAQRFGLSA